MKKRTFFLVCTCSCLFSMTSMAGQLVQDEAGSRYIEDDGTFAVGWHQEGLDWYYFDADTGYAHRGWLGDNGNIYYLRPDTGVMISDRTLEVDGKFFRFNSDGVGTRLPSDYEGWMRDDAGWYYRFSDGSRAADRWLDLGGEWYYFDNTGYMKTGMIEYNGSSYYLSDSGAMIHDVQMNIDGTEYAFDSSGVATAVTPPSPLWPYKAPTVVLPEQQELWESTVAPLADSILAGLVNDQMTKRQKAERIYAWIRANFTYNGYTATKDWVQEAYTGFRKRHGDCFMFYSVSQALLTRCNITSIEMIRSDGGHYWNLVQLDDGNWYHFDATPRRMGGYFCLWTDAQMAAYSAIHGNCFAFDRELYPKTP